MAERDYIPSALLVEILSRLPARSLMRFKCVSKHWSSLITDPDFVELHRTRSCKQEGDGNFVIPTVSDNDDGRHLCFIDLKKEPLDRVSVLEPLIPCENNRTSNIVNGLICFYHERYDKRLIYVYNITTRECISLPPMQLENTRWPLPLGRFSRKCFLGFDPINKEYKVLHFQTIGAKNCQCQVFTIGGANKRWRPLDVPKSHPEDLTFTTREHGFCLGGFLYWAAHKVFFKFDVRQEKLKFIRFPQELNRRAKPTLVQLQERVCLIEHFYNPEPSRVDKITILWWLNDDELLWTKELPNSEIPFRNYGCNHVGQVFSVHFKCSNLSILDYYDLATRTHQELEVNNARGILWRVCLSGATSYSDNIMPLKHSSWE